MSLIHRLFGSTSDATLLCPRCERSLDGHDDAACARVFCQSCGGNGEQETRGFSLTDCKRCGGSGYEPARRTISRRWFIGAALGAAASAIVAPVARPLDVIMGVDLGAPDGDSTGLIWRIPIQMYRGGRFAKYNPDDGSIGRGNGWEFRAILAESSELGNPELLNQRAREQFKDLEDGFSIDSKRAVKLPTSYAVRA